MTRSGEMSERPQSKAPLTQSPQTRICDVSALHDGIGALTSLLGPRASTGPSVRDQYSRGESYHAPAAPDVVCFPETTDEVAAILRISKTFQLPVVPFGAGTSLEGHVHALRGGISIDLTRLNRILRISSDDLDATVEA